MQRKEHLRHHDQHSDGVPVPSETFLELENGEAAKNNGNGSRSSSGSVNCTLQPSAGVIYESQEQAIKASFGHQQVHFAEIAQYGA